MPLRFPLDLQASLQHLAELLGPHEAHWWRLMAQAYIYATNIAGAEREAYLAGIRMILLPLVNVPSPEDMAEMQANVAAQMMVILNVHLLLLIFN